MILVTGATGTTGRAVVEALRRIGGARLRLAVRDAAAVVLDGPGSEAVTFDFRDPSTFEPALRGGVRAVFLLRPPALARPQRDFGPFVVAMRRTGVAHVVFLSVRGAATVPVLPHRGIERLIEASRLPFTHLRPSDFMQNLLTVHREDIRDRGEIWAPAGCGRAAWVDVRDVAEVAARILAEGGHLGQAYALTGPEALDFRAAAALLSDRIGHPVTFRDPSLPAFVRRALSRPRGRLAVTLVMAGIYTAQRLGMAAEVDPTLGRLLGRAPRGLATFVSDHAEAWRRA